MSYVAALMKYLHLPEHDVMYEIPFSKGLQYQHAIIALEGGQAKFVATPDEIRQNKNLFDTIVSQDIEEDYYYLPEEE